MEFRLEIPDGVRDGSLLGVREGLLVGTTLGVRERVSDEVLFGDSRLIS